MPSTVFVATLFVGGLVVLVVVFGGLFVHSAMTAPTPAPMPPRLSDDVRAVGTTYQRAPEWGPVTYLDVSTRRVVWRSDWPLTAKALHDLGWEAAPVG